jgi:hypothetical protein
MAVMRACDERAMPVSILSVVKPELEQLEQLAAAFPSNPLIVEHFGGAAPRTDGWEQVDACVPRPAQPALAG